MTVISKQKLLDENEPFRFDSEFNLKQHRIAIERVIAFGSEKFEQSEPTIIHPHEIEREYSDDGGVWFFRAQNGRPLQIDDSDKVYISTEDARHLSRNILKQGDVLITRTGANRGDCSYFNSGEEAIASSHTLIIRSQRWKHEFLVAFFNSFYGKAQIDKGVYGAVQPQIAPYFLRKIWIPNFSMEFQNTIRQAFVLAGNLRGKSNAEFQQAEQTLLHALGLDTWQPPEPLTYQRKASEAFAAERLDAEHFQPKYQAIRELLSQSFKLVTLAEMGEVAKGVTVPYAEEGTIPIIRSGDLTELDNDDKFLRAEPSCPVFSLMRGDVLISSIGFGSIGKVQVFDKLGAFGTVSEVTVVRQNCLNPYYLLFYLRSCAGQLQIERFITGATGQLHLYPKDVSKFFVPMISVEEQVKFEEMAKSAEAARKQAHRLLERAKRAVEIAIEESEAAALAFLLENSI